MQGYTRIAMEMEKARRGVVATLGQSPAHGRQELTDARYYSAGKPALTGDRVATGRELQRCHQHAGVPEARCVNCETPLCPDCEYLLINGRPWCRRCGGGHQPSLLKDVGWALWAACKAVAVLAMVTGVVLYVPASLDVRVFTATFFGLLGLWFAFVQYQADIDVRVVKPRRHRRLQPATRPLQRAVGVSRA